MKKVYLKKFLLLPAFLLAFGGRSLAGSAHEKSAAGSIIAPVGNNETVAEVRNKPITEVRDEPVTEVLNVPYAESDTLTQIQLEEVIVSGTRAGNNTPVSFSNISAADIKKENAARNIPAVLQYQPSIVSFTEDGLGVGNTSFRIRGTDATRINVTLNGMPLNNPESQEVFWVNLPDLSNTLQNIQIQRGVGTSTNGSAAFGASISLQTLGAHSEAYGEASTAVGSYGTFLSNIAAGTGILKNGLSFDTRFSRVLGDGYIRNGKVNHTNFYAALSHYGDSQLIRLIYIKGIQHTGITWNGVSMDEINKHGRRYNSAGKYKDDAGNRFYYDNETDNYYSDIAQLTFVKELNPNLSLNTGLSYNHGYGYFENYQENKEFSKFGLAPQTIGDNTYNETDFIRRKLMKNDFYVANLGFNYTKNALGLTFGAMYSLFDGDHYGRLPWIKHPGNIAPEYEWYRNTGKKSEVNLFAKAEYQLNDKLSLFGDLQYRHITYRLKGIDDDLVDLTSQFNYNFVNPKAGLSFRLNDLNRFYASVAVGQREPLRTDLKVGINKEAVNPIKPERMIDYELGYRYQGANGIRLGANFYYMDYHNQMVQTGKLNDVGYKLMENVKKSYRTGIELEAAIPVLNNKFLLDANATISRNKIDHYTAYFDLYNSEDKEVHIDNDPEKPQAQVSKEFKSTDISYSPNLIGSLSLTYQPVSSFYVNLAGKYVGKQYLDNTSDNEKSLDAYFLGNFSAGYTFNPSAVGTFNLQVFVNNLFNNKKYFPNGLAGTSAYEDGSTTHWVAYYPQAPRNYMVRLTLNF